MNNRDQNVVNELMSLLPNKFHMTTNSADSDPFGSAFFPPTNIRIANKCSYTRISGADAGTRERKGLPPTSSQRFRRPN